MHQVEFGGEYEQQTRRFFSIFANTLASFITDDDGAEQGEGVAGYSNLPFNAMDATGYTYYGYDYLGLNEVDSQDIDDWFEYDTLADDPSALTVDLYNTVYYAV